MPLSLECGALFVKKRWRSNSPLSKEHVKEQGADMTAGFPPLTRDVQFSEEGILLQGVTQAPQELPWHWIICEREETKHASHQPGQPLEGDPLPSLQ